MTCNDCIHFDLCIPVYSKIFGKGNGLDAEAETDGCGYFKDRSRFVELPCKDGEYVYVIEPLCDSMAFHTIKHRKIKHIEPQARIQFAGGGWILDFLSAFNRYVFRTYEEAEQALKERE